MSTAAARLLILAEREFRTLTNKPLEPPRPRRFKALKIRLEKFNAGWDRRRGSMVRLAGVLLRDDDAALERRVCESEQSARTYGRGVELLEREARYLRRVSHMLERAAGRLSVTLERCRRADPQAPATD